MTTAETERLLADRYGRRRPRLVWWIVGGILVASVIGYVAWTTIATATRSVDFDTTGFTLVDEHAVTVQFQVVTPRPGTAIACAVEAQDEEHGVVGWRVVEFEADDAHTRRFEVEVPTTATATTGLATSCWIP